jgi:serine protease
MPGARTAEVGAALPIVPAVQRAIVALALGAWLLGLAAVPAIAAPAAPNDPLFRYQWNLRAIGIPAAWAVTRGAGATVAVLDTGVAYRTHGPYSQAPDLAGTRFAAGWDFVAGDRYPDDEPPRPGRRSHGTQMAGLIAQTTGNALGGAGVAPAATIMPIRVLRPDLSGTARDVARGLRFAADHGADVANLSFAGPTPTSVITEAVEYATAKGVTIVAAAGNDGGPVDWPAAYPQVIAVGAVAQDLRRASYSSFGRALDIAGPSGAGEAFDTGRGPSDGVLAQTLFGPEGRFCFCFTASTSAAAAQVSGVAALNKASGRAAGPAQIRRVLLSSARDLGPRGRDDQYGAGLVQAARAVGVSGPEKASRAGGGSSGAAWLLVALALAAIAAAAVVLRRRAR